MNEKILKIRQQLTEIKSITLENMQINFGKENIIVIKINNKKDISKWDYFCERLSRQCDSVHIIKKYPEIIFKLPLKKDVLTVGLEGLSNALNNKYYLINKPKETNVTIIAKVTNLCNLDCQYCYDKPFRDKLGHNGILDLKKLEHLIEMATRYAEHITILWHGGEPSLAGINYYKEIYDYILPKFPYAEFEIDMQTNGTLIDSEWIKFCKDYNMPIGSSYNATQEDLRHTLEANELGSQEHTIFDAFENIKKAISENVSGGVIDVMTKENHCRIKEIYEFYKDQGVNACFNEIHSAGEAEKHDFLFITKQDKEEYKKTTVDYFTHWANDKDERCFLDRYASDYIQVLLTGQSYICHNGNRCVNHWIGINSNGDLYPCDRALPEKYRIGNVMEFSKMEEIYNSPKYKIYAEERNSKLNNRCVNCVAYHYCNGNCPMIDIDASGSAAIANEYACSMQKLNLLCAYKALFNTDINHCNNYLRTFLIKNCVFLPKEIPVLLSNLGITNSEITKIQFDNSKEASLEGEDFKLFAAINAPVEEKWIVEDFVDFYTINNDEHPEDDRFERAVKAFKEKSEMITEKIKNKPAKEQFSKKSIMKT